jgi:hypothetical protein
MILSIMQPAYLPWLGYFHRIATSDLHIVLDHVPIDKNSKTKFANRNKIRTNESWCWLTVPIMASGASAIQPINKIAICDDGRWRKKHGASIRCHYAKASNYGMHSEFFERIYGRPWRSLSELTRETTRYLFDALGIQTPVLFSSDMGVTGKKDELILNLCRATGASTYLSGPFGRDYLDERTFLEDGREIVYHEYRHPSYTQVYRGFEPYMSVIDLLLNCGGESSKILMGGQTIRGLSCWDDRKRQMVRLG